MSRKTSLYLPNPTPGNVNCYECEDINVPGCARCKLCVRCGCRCEGCEICKSPKPPGHKCKICGECQKICNCRKKPLYIKLDSKDPHVGNKLSKLTRPIGMEIELVPVETVSRDWYQKNPKPTWLQWDYVRDGSLNGMGKEMVVQPLWGDRLVEGIGYLSKMFQENGFGVDHNCGFHVHVGAGNFSAFDLRRVITLYQKISKEIYSYLIYPERMEGKYCKPYKMDQSWWDGLWKCKETGEIKAYLLKWMYSERLETWKPSKKDRHVILNPQLESKTLSQKKQKLLDQIRSKATLEYVNVKTLQSHKYEQARYYGLNIHSWMQRGTIEWRHYQGTIKRDELLNWALFCGWTTQLAGVLTDSEVQSIEGIGDLFNLNIKRDLRLEKFPLEVKEWVMERIKANGVRNPYIQPVPIIQRNPNLDPERPITIVDIQNAEIPIIRWRYQQAIDGVYDFGRSAIANQRYAVIFADELTRRGVNVR